MIEQLQYSYKSNSGRNKEFPTTRPVARPGQVLDVSEIVPGKKYTAMFNPTTDKPSEKEFVALKSPAVNEMGSFVVLGREPDGKESSFYLGDLSVVPCGGDGSWNPYHWLRAIPEENNKKDQHKGESPKRDILKKDLVSALRKGRGQQALMGKI